MIFGKRRKGIRSTRMDIDPDEIFLDSSNVSEFDVHRFEGRLEQPIAKRTLFATGIAFAMIALVFLGKIGLLQIRDGTVFAATSERNRLEHQVIFATRGIVTDRNGIELAWNLPNSEGGAFALRQYTEKPGFAHLLGYVQYPARDSHGVYYRTTYEPNGGVEQFYDDLLKGKQGLRIIETDAHQQVISHGVIDPPLDGKKLVLTIDAPLQEQMYRIIRETAEMHGWRGGSGILMDIESGELLAITSYPEFDLNVLTAGEDRTKIASYNADKATPFLDRSVGGLYTPGSIVKTIDAIGALQEKVITPDARILSTGSISVPNPYFPEKKSIFTDWKAHGWVDMRTAIAQSSNVYFYEIGGGFQSQKGLGIVRLEKYFRMFGYGSTTGVDLRGEVAGTIPNPEWKAKVFDGEPWRLGDTYFTSIGQYGVQITPLQAAKQSALIASSGKVTTPHVWKDAVTPTSQLDIPKNYFAVVQEGMRKGATDGTAKAINFSGVRAAAKTGTAELGVSKSHVNSWIIGFFPYDKPRYAFAVVMERGKKGNQFGAAYVERKILEWMVKGTPGYLKGESLRGSATSTLATSTLPLLRDVLDEVVLDDASSTPEISSESSFEIDETPPEIPPVISPLQLQATSTFIQ